MDDLQALRNELAELRREVKTLRRTRWITPGSFGLVLVAMVTLGVARQLDPPKPQTDHTPVQVGQDIVCKSLKVVDGNNQVMAQIASDKDGGLFVINGADGKKRFFTAVENTAGFTDWYDAAGNRRATVFVGEKGNSEFHLTDKLDHVSAVLQQADAGGFLALRGPDNNYRLAAGVDNGGGYLDIYDTLGERRGTMYLSEQNTAQLKLIGSDKVARLLMSGNKDSGQATSYGADGKPVAVFPPAKTGP